MPLKRFVHEAMFDIQPVRSPGILDLEKIKAVKVKLDLRLRPQAEVAVFEKKIPDAPEEGNIQEPEKTPVILPEPLSSVNPRLLVIREFEKELTNLADLTSVVVSMGGEVHTISARELKPADYFKKNPSRIGFRAEMSKGKITRHSKGHPSQLENFWVPQAPPKLTKAVSPYSNKLVSAPRVVLAAGSFGSPGAREIEFWLNWYKQGSAQSANKKRITFSWLKRLRLLSVIPVIILVSLIFAGYWGGISLKNNILKNGDQAVVNLEQAKMNLVSLDFLNAANRFTLAYEDFGKASETLNGLGSNFLSAFSGIPGLGGVKAASDIVSAGQYISKAGADLALAFGSLSKTNFFSGKPISPIIKKFKEELLSADKNISKAHTLLLAIDPEILPPDKRSLLIDFQEKIPEFQKYVGEAIDYSNFLLGIVGDKSPKTYILLLQNNSELRATGGFPGTYAVVKFDQGELKSVVIDDIYNIDGQMKENIIPPVPLQHITPSWGMRDANWFADFPSSARKVEEMYQLDGGPNVDGVMTITPDVIIRLLAVTGPIELPGYGMTINSENFLTEIQEEVEYGQNRVQPKTIVKDFQPRLFEKLAALPNEKWMEIFQVLIELVKEKHILAYFDDYELQKKGLATGVAGELRMADEDYLQVVFSNVKGSKTDAYLDTSFNLAIDVAGEGLRHWLTINRVHHGGDTLSGFYNKTNPAYVRLYLPLGSAVKSIQGHSLVDFRPLLGYADFGFKDDPDLQKIQMITEHPFTDVDVTEENGKTVIGFWLVVKPKEKKSVVVEYETKDFSTDNDYSLLWQKQSGTAGIQASFVFELANKITVSGLSQDLQRVGDSIIFNSDLSTDKSLEMVFH